MGIAEYRPEQDGCVTCSGTPRSVWVEATDACKPHRATDGKCYAVPAEAGTRGYLASIVIHDPVWGLGVEHRAAAHHLGCGRSWHHRFCAEGKTRLIDNNHQDEHRQSKSR